jgi:hypothetical protein
MDVGCDVLTIHVYGCDVLTIHELKIQNIERKINVSFKSLIHELSAPKQRELKLNFNI